MKIRPLSVAGAFEVTPVQHGDPRGLFLEWFRPDILEQETGCRIQVAQANLSVSARGVVRGVHFADVPPGQAKYVVCVRGTIVDVVVDLRTDSPTFGQWEGVRLDDTERKAVYLSEGLGHGFCALTDDATVAYLCSTTYSPATNTPFTRSIRTCPSPGRLRNRACPRGTPQLPAWPRPGREDCSRTLRHAV